MLWTDVEEVLFSPSISIIAVSTGSVALSITVWGEAPGYTVIIVVMGSSMSGIISRLMRSVAQTETPTRATANTIVIQRLIKESLVSRCII